MLFFTCVSSGFLYSQISEKRKVVAAQFVKQAKLVMEGTKAKEVAKELFIQAARIDPENIEANYMAGELYLATINKDRAATFFRQVEKIDPNYRFNLDYLIGKSYHLGLDFDEAIDHYKKYKEKLTSRPDYYGEDRIEMDDVDRRIEECYNGKNFVENTLDYSITNLGAQVNSVFDDYGPVITKDNNLMIFTTRRKDGNLSANVDEDNEPFEEVFYTRYEGNAWDKAQNIGEPINTVFHNSNLALSADGNILFLYTDENNGDILVSKKNGDNTWSKPESIGPNINSLGYKESSVCLSPDGEILYFSSNRPGGLGGSDIYYSIKDKKGNWKKGKNLGSVINTAFDDDGPFIDFSGNYLYFSSKGHTGMGGYDIFKSEYDSLEEVWKEPENMGFPINTPDDDIYFVMTNDNKTGYYATIRDGGFGLSDIYMITEGEYIPPDKDTTASEAMAQNQQKDSTDSQVEEHKIEVENIILTVRVRNQNDEDLSAKVSLINVENQVLAAQKKVRDGVYKFKIEDANNATYRLSVEKDGYAFVNENMPFTGSEDEMLEIEKVITLSPLTVGTNKVLRNIYFDFNRATIKPESFEELGKVENMMARNPAMTIELGGHTDAIGDAVFNKSLSQYRVDEVKKYLVKKGVDPRRIKTMGYGEEKPLATNDDEKEGRELNRRVEFTVLEN